MPDPDHRRPPPVTCEDWDEEAQAVLPGSQKTANVSTKQFQQDLVLRQKDNPSMRVDGGDSGYASRAPTIGSDSTSSSRRKMSDLKVDTAGGVRERDRNPYLYSQNPVPKQSSHRHSSSQSKEPSPEKRSTRFRDDGAERGHPENHMKHPGSQPGPRAAHPPSSPVTLKTQMPKATRDDQVLPTKSRRSSSNQHQRPVSMALPPAAYAVQYAVYPTYDPTYTAVPVPVSGYATPVTPSVPYGSVPFSYAPPPTLPTPLYGYPPQPPPPSYFDQLPEPRSAKPSRNPSPVRRSNTYGEPPLIRHGHADSEMPLLERRSSKEAQPGVHSHKSARSIEVERERMPPPPRPNQPGISLSRRPSNRRSQTYHPQESTIRERVVLEPTVRERVVLDADQYDSDDDRDYRVVHAPPSTTVRERRESASRPPSSYRPLAHAEPGERPPARKSVSYSTGTTVTKTASSTPHAMPRRMTVPLEQKEAEIEEYQAKRSRVAAANGLTAEALRKLDQRTSSSKSETGSNFSHQSSSKDSSGRGRSQTTDLTKTSITLPGGMTLTIPADYVQDGRPLSISTRGFNLTVGGDGKENERSHEQKRIERPPSIASRTSKQSAASSAVSSRDNHGREVPRLVSRRPSQLEERVPSSKSSRQPSRAPSMTRRNTDYSSRRQSVDFSREYDEFYAAGS